jgi:hypothetical protein
VCLLAGDANQLSYLRLAQAENDTALAYPSPDVAVDLLCPASTCLLGAVIISLIGAHHRGSRARAVRREDAEANRQGAASGRHSPTKQPSSCRAKPYDANLHS